MILEFTHFEKEPQVMFCPDLHVRHHKLLLISERDGRWELYKTPICNTRQQEISM